MSTDAIESCKQMITNKKIHICLVSRPCEYDTLWEILVLLGFLLSINNFGFRAKLFWLEEKAVCFDDK